MPHNVRKLLIDISLSCEEIIEFTVGKSFEDFQENRILQLAIEREFEIIGEALSRLSRIDAENLEERIPEYRKIIDFRNIISHGYDVIDEMALWDFTQNKVPELLNKV
ncbi:MAG: HepT-like ribonuclease domain-containing protein [Gracilimonas sp.]